MPPRAGVTLHRVAAVDAADPAAAPALDALAARGPVGHLGRGTLACTLSHGRAWQTFLDTGGSHAAFLEDDVILADDIAAVLSALPAAMGDWPLAKLELGRAARDGMVLGAPVGHAAGRGLRPCHQLSTDAAGYVLSRTGAQQALARLPGCDVGVDHFLFYPRLRRGGAGLRFLQMDPAVVMQDPALGSDIAARRHTGSAWQRRLRRAGYEIAPAPGMLAALLRGARVLRPHWAARLP